MTGNRLSAKASVIKDPVDEDKAAHGRCAREALDALPRNHIITSSSNTKWVRKSPNGWRLSGERSESGASPLKPRVRRELVDETGHGWTIRLGRAAVQRAGAGAARKPLRRKGRALLRRDLCRRRPGRNGCTMRVRAATRVVACPAPHISRESPNNLELSGERSESAAATG